MTYFSASHLQTQNDWLETWESLYRAELQLAFR